MTPISEDETFRLLIKIPHNELMDKIDAVMRTSYPANITPAKLVQLLLDNHWTVAEGVAAIIKHYT